MDDVSSKMLEDLKNCNSGRDVFRILYPEVPGSLCDLNDHTLEDLTTCDPGRDVYWNRYLENPDYLAVLEKIESAFSGVHSFPLERICFQFWGTQVHEDGRLVLECNCNPCAMTRFDQLLHSYRECSVKYRYCVTQEDNNNYPFKVLRSGLPATAFLNKFPEVVFDLSVHRGSPVVDCALACDLTCCMFLPVFLHGSYLCLGVVECSMKHPRHLLVIFNEMKRELERQGLSIYNVQDCSPDKAIEGDLDRAKMEIQQGLKIACESHDLTLGQVWISYESKKGQHASDQMKRAMLVQLASYCVDYTDDPLSSVVNDFYDKLNVIALKEREGLVWKALQTHQQCFCRNIYKLSDNRGLLEVLSATNLKCACFVICMRSTHTGEQDYAFEFFWPQDSNHSAFVKDLLLTLRQNLPSFSVPKIHVVDASSGSGNTTLKRYALNFIKNPEGVKDEEDVDDLSILAFYGNDATLFYLPVSSTVENHLWPKLRMEFKLDPASDYKVEHEVSPGQWQILESLQTSVEDASLIKLRVMAVSVEVGWKWKTINN